MQCSQCGSQFADGMPSCPNCGTPVTNPYAGTQAQPYMQNQSYNQAQSFNQEQAFNQGQPYNQAQSFNQGQPYMQGQPYNQGQPYGTGVPLTKREFLKHPNMKQTASSMSAVAIALYICAGLSLVVGILCGNYGVILDVMLMVGFALGVHLGQSRVCAILVLIYSIANVIITIVVTGRRGGTWIVIASIGAVIATFRFHKAWNTYKQTGVIPMVNK